MIVWNNGYMCCLWCDKRDKKMYEIFEYEYICKECYMMNKEQLLEYYEELIKRGNLKQEDIKYLQNEINKLRSK